MVAIRNGPSGPAIKNDNGAVLEFGAGTIVRKVTTHMRANPVVQDDVTKEISSNMADDLTDFRATLQNCKAGLKYIARVRFIIAAAEGTDGTSGTLSVDLKVLPEGGGSGDFVFINNMSTSAFVSPRPTVTALTYAIDFESEPFDASLLPTWVEGAPLTVAATLNQFPYTSLGSVQLFSQGELGTAIISLEEVF